MAKAFILCGSTGAGKTTYAKTLSELESAQVFSIDEWMQNLFWMDKPVDEGFPWVMERIRRCEVEIWLISERLLRAGISVVLDLGFSKREQREKFYNLVRVSRNNYQLYYLDIPVEVRRERVKFRNENKAETFQIEVSEEIFDWMENFFEPPQAKELAGAVVIK